MDKRHDFPLNGLSTLCYMEQDGKYLMLHRVVKKNDINHDKWIGVGGHFEQDESPEECIVREVREETGFTLTDYRFRGLVTFVSGAGLNEYMHLFTATGWTGTPHACNEGVLEWVDKKDIRDLTLWEGDRIFFRLLEERDDVFLLKLVYDGGDTLVSASVDGEPLELLDVLDENGEKTGIVRERNVCHRDGSLHGTVHIWLVRERADHGFDVLIQKRSETKDSNPGAYDASAAGHITAGCGAPESARRELEEELGIRAEPEDLTFLGRHYGRYRAEFHGRPFIDNEDVSVFLCRKDVRDEDFVLQASEVSGVRWMDLDECEKGVLSGALDSCIYPDEFQMIRDHLTGRD